MSVLPTITAVAKAVATALQTKAASATPFAQAVVVEFSYLPQHEPAELSKPTITVVPKTVESELAARVGLDRHYQVDLGIQAKTPPVQDPAAMEPLMALVVEIDTFLGGLELTGAAAAVTWVGSANNPIYSVEHLRKGVFTSVLTLTYRGVG